jgi:DNA repair protein RecN (Recombination protein N)
MSAARIEFMLGPLADGGIEPAPVAVRFGPNPGEPTRPLARIASGGELSRVMLALKSAMSERDRVDLLFFDEVDSGIGGAVARAVGERLHRLAAHRQIVCVTHLALIAALAGHHLRVVKQVRGGRTIARIEPVEGPARVDEIARMLAGDRVTETTRRQARELMQTPAGNPAR